MKPVISKNAPAAIGPYSQAIAVNGLLFVSGQLPIDPATGDLAASDAAAQMHQCMKNLAAIAEEAGTSLANTVKTTILLRDMAGFAAVNDAYAKHLTEPYPARATFEVSKLPRDALVEVEAVIALKGN